MLSDTELQLQKDISQLQELVCTKLNALDRLTDERFKSSGIALKLQSEEYARRLESLNGEATRLRDMQSTYLPREVYESHVKSLNDKVESLITHGALQEGKIAGVSAMWVIITVAMGMGISLAALVVNIIK